MKDKEAKNQQIIKLIEVMQMLADSCSDIVSPLEQTKSSAQQRRLLDDDDEKIVKKIFLESALLPILEAALRSGSILEMAKEFDLYTVLLQLIETFSKKQVLLCLLNDIGSDYQPR